MKGTPEIISEAVETFHVNNIRIKGVRSFQDDEGGRKRGFNIIYIIEMDGIRVCHCGDLGHSLTPEQVDEIGRVDVLIFR